jgi:hypothetical protein
MQASLFWLDDEAAGEDQPLISMNRPGQDRRIIKGCWSGIISCAERLGCRWQTVHRNTARIRGCNGFNRFIVRDDTTNI